MDHRAFVASLTKDQRRRLTDRADAPGLANLALHWGAILAIGFLIATEIPGWPALVLAQGIALVFLFTLLHETIHRTAFRTPWLNGAVARTCGFLILLPSDWFRYFHFAHHRHTQDSLRDPELATGKPDTWPAYVAHVSGLPVLWSQARTLAQNAFGGQVATFVPATAVASIRREARINLLIYALAFGVSALAGSALLLKVWVVPVFLGQPFLRLYLLAEHGRCPHVANMLANSRTTFTFAFVRRLAWNMPYHAEHHVYPAVPFHRLPVLHGLLSGYLQTTERGYGRFHRKYVAAFKR